MKQPADELNQWHRYFAVECNNIAWSAAEADPSTRDHKSLLNAAHASVFHWLQVGNELNKIRGFVLLAYVHALCGHGTLALEYAGAAREYYQGHPYEEWELAFACMIQALAAHVASDTALHRSSYSAAQEVLDAMPDGEEKEIVLRTWVNIPA